MRTPFVSVRQIALSALFCSFVSLSLSVIYISNPPQSVVSFDEKKTTKRFIAQLSHQNKTDSEIELITKRFAMALKKSLHDFANDNHVIILKENNTLGSGVDRTSEISLLVAKNMRAKR